MPRNKGWHRVYDRHIDSPQIMDLADPDYRILMGIWSIASGNEGHIPFNPRQLRKRLYRSESEAEFADILQTLQQNELIEIGSDLSISVSRWTQHQYDNPSDAPEATRARKAKQVEKTKAPDTTEPNHDTITSNSRPNHDTEQSRAEERREEESRAEQNPARDDVAPETPPALPAQPSDASVSSSALPSPSVTIGLLIEADVHDLQKSGWTMPEILWGCAILLERKFKPKNVKGCLHKSILPDVRAGKRPKNDDTKPAAAAGNGYSPPPPLPHGDPMPEDVKAKFRALGLSVPGESRTRTPGRTGSGFERAIDTPQESFEEKRARLKRQAEGLGGET